MKSIADCGLETDTILSNQVKKERDIFIILDKVSKQESNVTGVLNTCI